MFDRLRITDGYSEWVILKRDLTLLFSVNEIRNGMEEQSMDQEKDPCSATITIGNYNYF